MVELEIRHLVIKRDRDHQDEELSGVWRVRERGGDVVNRRSVQKNVCQHVYVLIEFMIEGMAFMFYLL